MHKLYDLKEMLCEELKEYGSKDKLDVGALDIVDKLAHAVKNIDKIIEKYEEEGYSNEMGDGSYRGSMSYRGGSYARGRGRNARRDSMGRYSSERGYSRAEDEFAEELRELIKDAPNDRIRQKMQSIMSEM